MTLELRKVCISDELLHNLLSNCFLLEKLSLIQCQGPFNLNIGGSGSGSSQGRLKFLCIKCCPTLNRIEISSESLASLEYTGILINFSFKYVRNLTETYLYFSTYNGHNGVTYALTRLGSEIPQLKKLNFLSVKSMNVLKLPNNELVFTNVKLLILTIYPFQDEDRLIWIAYILRAFPLLQKLELNLFTPNFIKQTEMIERLLAECPHEILTEVEINGFNGNQHEVELLSYLLENLVKLKTLVIDSCPKIYQGCNSWVYEEANSWCKFKNKEVSDCFHELVPKAINLIVQ
ncbi:uncharacterized protein LOC123220114 isoform X2 [Mangifera indica]|uniref:uncharacterized protein LOC123220114 isoform X2 n=1 Tax=Mangifera indica TaxID=29780 RepID=UPI001CFC3EF5|nr:uncharacterized protein LOC123220114 isoform X2 [Mangifera indica]